MPHSRAAEKAVGHLLAPAQPDEDDEEAHHHAGDHRHQRQRAHHEEPPVELRLHFLLRPQRQAGQLVARWLVG
jgi:hypothetical protein